MGERKPFVIPSGIVHECRVGKGWYLNVNEYITIPPFHTSEPKDHIMTVLSTTRRGKWMDMYLATSLAGWGDSTCCQGPVRQPLHQRPALELGERLRLWKQYLC